MIQLRSRAVTEPGPVKTEPEVHPSGRSRLAMLVALVALGLGTQALGYAFGYSGHAAPVIWLFFVGVTLIYLPCAVVLLSRATLADERRAAVVLLGLALLASSILQSPLIANGFDALLHQTTLWQMPFAHALFTDNTVLPVSPAYPGLELVTLGLKLVTGLPSIAAEDLTVALARLGLTVVLYLFIARATRSERAGGIAVLVYAASPQFYAFNAAFSYQTLALAFAAAAVYFLFVALDQPEPRFDRHVAAAVVSLACLVITHHLVSWLTIGLLVVWTLALRRQPDGQTRVRILGRVTLLGLVMCAVWSAIAARRLVPYLTPILSDAWSGLIGVISGHGSRRQLFQAGSTSTPLPEEILVVASVLIIAVLTVLALRAVVFRGALRGGAQRFIPVLVAAAYPIALVAALSTASAEVGQRASTFIFLGIAMVIAAWLATTRARVALGIGAAIATVAFLGSLILGSGPMWSYVPGPYLPAADARSIDAPSIAAAKWAAANLPVNATIAADRDNQVLMAAIGHLRPVTALGGLVNVGPLYFDPVYGSYELSLIKKAQIRYLLVDDRLVEGPPVLGGAYFEPGETNGPERLTAADLSKFTTDPRFVRIYDNGPIQIYDLSAFDGTPAPVRGSVPSGLASTSGNGTMEIVFLVALALAIALRRRRGPIGLEGVVTATIVGLAMFIGFGILVVFARIGVGLVSVLALAIAMVASASLRWGGRHSAERAEGVDPLFPRRRTNPPARLLAVLAVTAALCATGAEINAQTNWMHPPPELSVASEGASTYAEIMVAKNQPVTLEALSSGAPVWAMALRAPSVTRVTLPPSVVAAHCEVRLVVPGQTSLEVNS